MKILKIKKNLTVIFDNGEVITSSDCTEDLYKKVLDNMGDDNFIKNLLSPKKQEKIEEIKTKKELLSELNNSKILSTFGASVYVKSISELTVPEDLAMAIWEAEKNENKVLLSTYLNFWTLACLNPDSRARTNLFWFLNKYGMVISSSGLFVAYRNVSIKEEGTEFDAKLTKFIAESFSKVRYKLKKSPKKYFIGKDANGEMICTANTSKISETTGVLSELYGKLSEEKVATTFTDSYSRTFTIKIGQPVAMERSKCDSKQENTCSRGLHVAGKQWLSSNYFGNTSLRVLVNPADVVAVPPSDNYGKMRTCAYYPISIVSFEDGKIVEEDVEPGFEDDFLNQISYEGEKNNEDLNPYVIKIPSIPELDKKRIMGKIEDIKKNLLLKHAH